VDPSFLDELVAEYTNVTFILLHSGFDFLPFNDTYFYNGTLVQESIDLAASYSNVWLEISAMFPADYTGRPRNPTGTAVVKQIKDAGLANRVMWGSDANFQGIVSIALEWGVEAMVEGGYSEDERCSALVNGAKDMFDIPDLPTQPPTMTSSCSTLRPFLNDVLITVLTVSVLS
jgi:predicted TIM-barrel fold metal-dependent hydrolase